MEDLVGTHTASDAPPAPKIRVGTLEFPLDTIEAVDLTPAAFETYKSQILAVEQERCGAGTQEAPESRSAAKRRPLLQLPLETLEATASSPRAVGIALRDRVSGRLVAYVLGSALEFHDEEGVSSDPRFGENNTFYLQAMATLPTAQNASDLESLLLALLRERCGRGRVRVLSTLIEDRLRETGPAWFRDAAVLERIEKLSRGRLPVRVLSGRAAGSCRSPIPQGSRAQRRRNGGNPRNAEPAENRQRVDCLSTVLAVSAVSALNRLCGLSNLRECMALNLSNMPSLAGQEISDAEVRARAVVRAALPPRVSGWRAVAPSRSRRFRTDRSASAAENRPPRSRSRPSLEG